MAPLPSWFRRSPTETPLGELAGPASGLAAILFERGSVGLVGVDHLCRIVRANPAARGMAGPQADLGPGAAASALFGPAGRAEATAELEACLSGSPARPNFAAALQCGAVVGVSVLALRRTRGPVCGALLQLTDFTAQRRLEAQLAEAQTMQALGHLAGSVAHDFNNLLTAILGAAESATQRGGLPVEAAADVAEIRASAGRGAALVRQLMGLVPSQAVPLARLDLNDLVSGVSTLLRRLLGRRVVLDIALRQPGSLVRAEQTPLEQVLVNLAVNAGHAMPDGGRLTLRTDRLTLDPMQPAGRPAGVPPGRYAVVEVEDTGAGIAPGDLARIFDPFFTTRRQHGGTGLGLATVQAIVHRYGGFLDVRSAPGQGTAVRMYLPRADEAAPVAAKSSPAVTGPLARPSTQGGARPGTVLIVDDEEPVRRAAARALSRAGWHVIAAADGEQAVAAAASHEGPPLVGLVADLSMHGMDGMQVLQAVRVRAGLARLPALLVSGYAEASVRRAVASHDRVAFLAKPYSSGELVDAFAMLLASGKEAGEAPHQP